MADNDVIDVVPLGMQEDLLSGVANGDLERRLDGLVGDPGLQRMQQV